MRRWIGLIGALLLCAGGIGGMIFQAAGPGGWSRTVFAGFAFMLAIGILWLWSDITERPTDDAT